MNETLQAIRDEWLGGGLAACLADQDVFLPSVSAGRVVQWSYTDEPDLIKTTMDKVDWSVAKSAGISVQKLHSRRRSSDVTIPRFLAMYLMSVHCPNRSLVEIGRHFHTASEGDAMDHTSIMHGIKRAAELLVKDPDFAAAHERAVVILEGLEA